MAVNGDVSERPSPAKVGGVFLVECHGPSGLRVGLGREAGCYICVRICVTRPCTSDSANDLNQLLKSGAANIPIECRYYPRKCSRYPDSSCGAANIPIAIVVQPLSR